MKFKGPSAKSFLEKHPKLINLIKQIPDFWNFKVSHLILSCPTIDTFNCPVYKKYIYDSIVDYNKKLTKSSSPSRGNYYTYRIEGNFRIDIVLNITQILSKFYLHNHIYVTSTDENYSIHINSRVPIGTQLTHHTIIESFNKLLNAKSQLVNLSENLYSSLHTLKEYLKILKINYHSNTNELLKLIPYQGDKYITCIKPSDLFSIPTIKNKNNIEPFSIYKHDRKKFESKSVVTKYTNNRYTPIIIYKLRRGFPELIANDLVAVQPMTDNLGFTFALRHQYRIQPPESQHRQLQFSWNSNILTPNFNITNIVNNISQEVREEIDRQLLEDIVAEINLEPLEELAI